MTSPRKAPSRRPLPSVFSRLIESSNQISRAPSVDTPASAWLIFLTHIWSGYSPRIAAFMASSLKLKSKTGFLSFGRGFKMTFYNFSLSIGVLPKYNTFEPFVPLVRLYSLSR
ncbi:MAG: hypothetical protein IPH20_17830 [Bacteroidales bacterium]|nr:hypothetical protein [Bacteroidales bacterium]